MTKSVDTYAEDFLELEMDSVFGVDPVQGRADLQTLKRKFRNSISIWGGINSAVTLGQGSEREIEQAVTEAIRVLAPGGGFVLYPVDVLLAGANPWTKVRILLNKWREIGNYPIRV
jgi:uroporphyrinogen decarboxylase